MTKKLSIIIVSWNVRELLDKCLRSIDQHRGDLDLEVVVVDNNSNDGSRALLEDLRFKIKDLRVILKKENLGFARGNNEGLKHAIGEYILFLNPDTEIVGDSLQTMVAFLDDHPEVGAIGPKLLNSDNSLQVSVRAFPTLFSQLWVLLKLHNFIPLKHYFQLGFDYSKEQDVDQIMGAALLVRSHILKNVGMFDGGYWRIYEEVDLCYRIKQAGNRIRYVPSAQIIHHRGQSFSKTRLFRKQLDFNQGMRRFFYKHKPRWQYVTLLLFQPVSWIVTGLQVILLWFGDPLRKRYKKKEL